MRNALRVTVRTMTTMNVVFLLMKNVRKLMTEIRQKEYAERIYSEAFLLEEMGGLLVQPPVWQ